MQYAIRRFRNYSAFETFLNRLGAADLGWQLHGWQDVGQEGIVVVFNGRQPNALPYPTFGGEFEK